LRVKSKIGPKGQVVIPKELREEFKLAPGDEVMFDAKEDVILIYPKMNPKKFVDELLRIVKNKKKAPPKIDWDKLYYSQFE